MHRTFVPIRTPCNVNWNNLRAVGKHRFCDDCRKVVHDLSSLNEQDARTLLEGERSDLCVRYLHDASGAIQFGDSPLIAPCRLASKVKSAAIALATPFLFQACGGAGGDVDLRHITVQSPSASNTSSPVAPSTGSESPHLPLLGRQLPPGQTSESADDTNDAQSSDTITTGGDWFQVNETTRDAPQGAPPQSDAETEAPEEVGEWDGGGAGLDAGAADE